MGWFVVCGVWCVVGDDVPRSFLVKTHLPQRKVRRLSMRYLRTCTHVHVPVIALFTFIFVLLPGRNGDHHGPPASIHAKLHASSQKHLEHNITDHFINTPPTLTS